MSPKGDFGNFKCVAHDDGSASCSISVTSGKVKCHADSCGWEGFIDDYASEFGLPEPPPKTDFKESSKSTQSPSKSKRDKPLKAPNLRVQSKIKNLVESYIYQDKQEQNVLLVDKKRWTENGETKKGFSQSHWRDGAWYFGTELADGSRLVPILYRIPQMSKENQDTVLVLEGEKDVETALKHGFSATCTPMGAGKADHVKDWTPLRGKHVVVISDNDDPGYLHAREVSRLASRVAKSVKIIDFPWLPEGGDFTDWIEQGGSREELLEIIKEIEPIEKRKKKPEVVVNNRDIQHVAEDILEVIGRKTPIFSASSRLVYIKHKPGGGAIMQTLKAKSLLAIFQRYITFVEKKERKTGTITEIVNPPRQVADYLMTFGGEYFPRLDQLVQVPVLTEQGTIIRTPGYDHRSKTFYAPIYKNLNFSKTPNKESVLSALNFIFENVMGDFPFDGPSSRVHALMAVFQPFLRPFIQGPTPVHLFTAATPGSGKSKLARAIALVSSKVGAKEIFEGKNGDEFKKSIGSALLEGPTSILLDNVIGKLKFPWLPGLLTSEYWSYRILGTNNAPDLPNQALWCITANNPRLFRDVVRRCVEVRIDARMKNPELRPKTTFRHQKLEVWIKRNRKKLIEAALTVVQGWVNAGLPMSNHCLGSFEHWSEVMGGLAEWLGMEGFLDGREEFLADADYEADAWNECIFHWKDRMMTEMKASDWLSMCDQHSLFGDELEGKSLSKRTQLASTMLRRNLGMIYGDDEIGYWKITSKKTRSRTTVYNISRQLPPDWEPNKLLTQETENDGEGWGKDPSPINVKVSSRSQKSGEGGEGGEGSSGSVFQKTDSSTLIGEGSGEGASPLLGYPSPPPSPLSEPSKDKGSRDTSSLSGEGGEGPLKDISEKKYPLPHESSLGETRRGNPHPLHQSTPDRSSSENRTLSHPEVQKKLKMADRWERVGNHEAAARLRAEVEKMIGSSPPPPRTSPPTPEPDPEPPKANLVNPDEGKSGQEILEEAFDGSEPLF